MIEIEEPPDVKACSSCMNPLTWVWLHHLNRNVAVIPVADVDRFTFRIHTCVLKAERTWRNVQRVSPELTRRGARQARAVLAAKAQKRTDERTT